MGEIVLAKDGSSRETVMSRSRVSVRGRIDDFAFVGYGQG